MSEWFEKEKNAYEKDFKSTRGAYCYYALNEYYGQLSNISEKNISILGYGAADGAELKPLIPKSSRVCIIDPTKKMKNRIVDGKEVEYSEPREDGIIDFADNSFDVITCFGVLMYIENPEFVINEMIRVLKVGGVMLLREPSTDMHVQDKSIERAGCGEYTRGLPESFYNNTFGEKKGLYEIKHCMFSPWVELGNKIMKAPLNHRWFVVIDNILCFLFSKNWKYQRKTIWDKFAPGSFFIRYRKE